VAAAGRASSTDDADNAARLFEFEREAHGLADSLPDLVLKALRVAVTVAHGLHGRRRSGPGETFWQFRQYHSSDAARLIDWRRSASSDHLYVREREWEAAHTVWLWPDLSPSMDFRSHLSSVTKRERAIVLMLAAAELLVRGGERVAILGLTRPSASRNATTKLAEAIALSNGQSVLHQSLPPGRRLSRYSGVLLISDFLDPVDAIGDRLRELAADGVSGHLLQVLDPAEETLPYEGRTEFVGMEDGERWVADRVETLREDYRSRLRAHRDGLEDLATKLGWSFLVHHTDRSAAEPLLALIARLQTGAKADRFAVGAAPGGAR
jgi:uncharacterized protein (DUF58 family)